MPHATTPNLGVQDFFTTTLSGNVAATDTVINLTNIPTPTEGYLVIDPNNPTTREIIYYNSKTSSTVTCPDATANSGRGIGGTSVQVHLSGVAVELRDVAEYWLALQNGQSLGAGSIPASALASGTLSNANLSNPYKFAVYKSASTQTATSGDTVTWDVEDYDTGNNFASNTFTAPVNGFYHFDAVVYVSAGTICYVTIKKNGSIYKRGAVAVGGGSDTAPSFSGDFQLSASDTITTNINFTGGGTKTVQNISGGERLSWFSGHMLSGT